MKIKTIIQELKTQKEDIVIKTTMISSESGNAHISTMVESHNGDILKLVGTCNISLKNSFSLEAKLKKEANELIKYGISPFVDEYYKEYRLE